MEFREANRILQSVKYAMAADGVKLPSSAETNGIMRLLDKPDADKSRARSAAHIARSARTGARDITVYYRALDAVKTGLPDPITYASIMLLHKSLFGDVDDDAGKPRVKEAATDGSAHTDPKYIAGSLKAILTKMNAIAEAPTISKDDFASYLTHYMRELIILHPFENGSRLTLRLFMLMFCKRKGFSLSYNRVTPQSIRSVEETAFLTDDVTPLYKLFINCLSYERTTVSPPKPARSKREAAAARRKPIAPKSAMPDGTTDAEIAAVKLKVTRADHHDIDDAKLKRIIRLQQKISKLNEQLVTELSSDDLATDD